MTLRQSIFQAREMLLDYYENKLDPERHELVKKVLSSDVETERILNQIKKGLEFSKQFSQVRINEEFSSQLLEGESLASIFMHYAKFKNWNQAFRTSAYAILGCAFVVVFVMSLPRSLLVKLKHRSNQEVILSQVAKAPDLAADAEDPEKRDAQADVAQNLPTDTDTDEDEAASEASGDEQAPPTIIARTADKSASKKPAAADSEADDSQVAAESENDIKDKITKGFVYRGTMKIDDLDERTPLISQQIAELGGRKAGEVELGWKKEDKGSYYHFSMPEENYEKLLEYLRGFGPVRFSKDSHPRVMPQGQIRIILWVERNNE